MKLTMFAAIFLIGLNASADYFKAGLGFGVGGKVKAENSTNSQSVDLENGFSSPLLLAYGFEMIGDTHGEIEFSYRKNEYDATGATAEPSFINGAFNVVGNAPMGGITLTGGAGITFGNFDPDSASDAGTAFGMQFFGGLDFPINEAITLGGEVRYMTTITKIDLGNNVEADYNNTSVLLNLKFGM